MTTIDDQVSADQSAVIAAQAALDAANAQLAADQAAQAAIAAKTTELDAMEAALAQISGLDDATQAAIAPVAEKLTASIENIRTLLENDLDILSNVSTTAAATATANYAVAAITPAPVPGNAS